MNTNDHSILQQIKRNAVALISLTVAVTGLGYNTWRNELTESNRNQRVAAFEILTTLGEIQNVVFHHHYDQDATDKGNPRTGWTFVLVAQDLSRVLNQPMQRSAKDLSNTWQANWATLQSDKKSADNILQSVEQMREQTIALLESLE